MKAKGKRTRDGIVWMTRKMKVYWKKNMYRIRKLNCTSSNIYQINSSGVQNITTDFF